MWIKLTWNELGIVLLMIFFGTLGYIPILMPSTGGALTSQSQMDQTHGINHIILLAEWAGIFFFMLKSRFFLRLDLLASKIALGYALYALSSMLWSSQRSGTFSGGLSLLISTIFAVWLVSKFKGERLTLLVSWLMFFLTMGSAFFALALPRYGIDHFEHAGAWQGMYGQKNGLGFVMVWGVAITLGLQPKNFVERCWKFGTVFLCAAEAGLSESREAWVLCAVLFMLDFISRGYARIAMRSRAMVLFISVGLAAFIGAVVATFWVAILTLLGRDATLTGRTVLWQAVLDQCAKHPLNGFGLTAFWGTGDALPVYAKIHWEATSAHNGFIETLLELGAIGVLLLVILIGIGLRNAAIALIARPNFNSCKSWMYCVIAITCLNMTGDITGNINSISWILLVCSACALEEEVRLGKLSLAKRRIPALTSGNEAIMAQAS